MNITKREFGKTKDGRKVTEYTMHDGESSVSVIDFGCAVTKIVVPDRDGNPVDVTLGYDTVGGYENSGTYFGAICGRCANRIANGRFTLNGKEYSLYLNDGPNSLHGGKEGFSHKLWDSGIEDGAVVMKYLSPDTEEGYPGNLKVKIRYSFSGGSLKIECSYKSDADTIANIVNHSYFNLNGCRKGSILNHTLWINADKYCENDESVMPSEEPVSVKGTPFDFTKPHRIGERISEDNEQLKRGKGYDHNWCLNNKDGEYAHAAYAVGDESGIKLDVYTDHVGLQFYSGNSIGHTLGKDGYYYEDRDGFCLEAQYYPNAINVPAYPSIVVKAGEEKSFVTEYVFSV